MNPNHTDSMSLGLSPAQRTAVTAASAALWCGLGWLALTQAPKLMPPPKGPPEIVIDGVARPKPPPPKPPEPVKLDPVRPQPVTPPHAEPAIAVRVPGTAQDRRPAASDPLPAGLPPAEPATAGAGPVETALPGPITASLAPEEAIALPPPLEPVAPPPQPVVIDPVRLSGTNPAYPPRALDRGIEGSVTLAFIVTPEGRVEGLAIEREEPGGHGFGRAALSAMRGWRFEPQRVDGVAVAWPARYTIRFMLEE